MKTVKLTLKAKAPWLNRLIKFVDELSPDGPLLAKVMKRVMIYGILRSVRTQFLAKQNNALRVSIESKATLMERAADTLSERRNARALETAYRGLDSAVMTGRAEKIKLAHDRIRRAENRVRGKYRGTVRYDGTKTSVSKLTQARNERELRVAELTGRLRLGAITGAMMRQRMLMLLRLLTSPEGVSDPIRSEWGVSIGAAPRAYINLLETPSATVLLSGKRSSSPFKVLWRHLEFGTGVYSSKHQSRLLGETPGGGRFKQSDGSWLYGRPGANGDGGLRVLGAMPMHFLWNAEGVPHPLHYRAALVEFDKAMQAITPKLT